MYVAAATPKSYSSLNTDRAHDTGDTDDITKVEISAATEAALLDLILGRNQMRWSLAGSRVSHRLTTKKLTVRLFSFCTVLKVRLHPL